MLVGERTLRRLLIIGACAVVPQASKRGAPAGSWLEGMLARKPRMLVTVALANKMARTVGALLVKQEDTELWPQSRRKPRRARGVGGRSRLKEGMAQQSAKPGRKNQGFPPCYEHAVGDLVPVRELPYGSAVRLHYRPNRWQHPTTCQNLKKTACNRRASTDGNRLVRFWCDTCKASRSFIRNYKICRCIVRCKTISLNNSI